MVWWNTNADNQFYAEFPMWRFPWWAPPAASWGSDTVPCAGHVPPLVPRLCFLLCWILNLIWVPKWRSQCGGSQTAGPEWGDLYTPRHCVKHRTSLEFSKAEVWHKGCCYLFISFCSWWMAHIRHDSSSEFNNVHTMPLTQFECYNVCRISPLRPRSKS